LAQSNLSGYSVGGSGSGRTSSAQDDGTKSKDGYWSLHKLKRSYLDYLGSKREEIDEQQDANRFTHGSQWTAEQITQLNARKQPVVWNNKTKRKINGIVGTLQRLRQDPKAYPRTPKHEQGAELATATIRYATERAEWDRIDPKCTEMCAINGIGGVEFSLEQGAKEGDVEIGLDVVYIDGFFYDPRSKQDDFSDARYLGVGKWLDMEAALELFPDKEDELEASIGAGEELSSDSDSDHKEWFSSTDNENAKRIRLVECWYKHKGKWRWAVFTGNEVLDEGDSPFIDEDNQSQHKYEMFSAYIDQDNDRYGFVRDLKPLNQEMNMRSSKALYTMLSRRIIAPVGAFDDIEVARREAARADGVVVYNPGAEKPEFDDTARQAETAAQLEFKRDVQADFESFGPNIAVTGEGLENSSGRAIHLLQQSGLADLGPFIQSYRGWKIRVYRKMWNAIQRHWTGERWIRVTDDEEIKQFVQINGVGIDPMTGQPTMVNSIGELDVDIILDEGPDQVNVQADAYEVMNALASKGGEVPTDILIELAPLPLSLKKRLLEKLNPEPTPEAQQRQQVEMQMGVETVKEKAASAELKKAQAFKAAREAAVVQPEQPEQGSNSPQDHPLTIQTDAIEKQASAAQKAADAEKKKAETAKIIQDIQLEPQRMAMEHQANQQKMQLDAQNAQADRQMQARQSEMSARQQSKDSERNYEVNKMKAKQKPASKKP
jgi:hypothetical protein